MKKDSFIYAVVFTFITAFIFVFIINLAGKSTQERVKTNNQLIRARSFLNAAGIAYSNPEEALGVIQKKLAKAPVPAGLKGPGITLITIGFMALAFMGFSGMLNVQ